MITKKRIWEIDLLRGLCVGLMIIDHCLYDFVYIFADIWPKMTSAAQIYFMLPARTLIRITVVVCFILLCGISCSFSHQNFKRGLKLLSVAIGLTVSTCAIDYWFKTDQFTIRFGVIHMLAVSILIYCLIKKIAKIYLLTFSFITILLGVYFLMEPKRSDNFFIACIINTEGTFRSSDYFPFLPWFGVFLIGGILGPIIYAKGKSLYPKEIEKAHIAIILWMGRHALLIYILHQPIIYGILSLGKLWIHVKS